MFLLKYEPVVSFPVVACLKVDFRLARSLDSDREIAGAGFASINVEFVVAVNVAALNTLSKDPHLVSASISDRSNGELEGTSY